MDGGRDGTRTRDPELAPSFPVRRLTPAACAVRALSKLGFGRKPTDFLYPPRFSRQNMTIMLSVITITPKKYTQIATNKNKKTVLATVKQLLVK
jgi:hypothetical protein